MRFDNLDDWLAWQQTLHPCPIELGLERVAGVWVRLRPAGLSCPVITIAGTNGKGSCAAMLEAVYAAAGFRTACYTSPHLLRYNERIRRDCREVGDEALCAAFDRVDRARGGISLTYFEFGTLAALDLFAADPPDVAILEVGLGGRLDAVNIVDPDVALVTSIGRDHIAWLGEDLDGIAFEKAGILRPGRPAVAGHRDPRPTLLQRAAQLGAPLHVLGRDFDWRCEGPDWTWTGLGLPALRLPAPALAGRFQLDNAAAVVTAVSCLSARLPVPADALRAGLREARVAGRFQVLPGEATWILDVAHNGPAAEALAANLSDFACPGRVHAVLGLLRDKEPAAIVAALASAVASWHLARPADPRAMPAAELAAAVEGVVAASPVRTYSDMAAALAAAQAVAAPGDCVLVLGSFTTVEAALRWRAGSPAGGQPARPSLLGSDGVRRRPV